MDGLCRNKRQFGCDRKYQEDNTNQLRQVFLCCDKVSNIKPTQGRTVGSTKKIMSQKTDIIHNQDQHNLCRDKDYFYRDKQNMKEVNSLSRQNAEEQHKKNVGKEILVAT